MAQLTLSPPRSMGEAQRLLASTLLQAPYLPTTYRARDRAEVYHTFARRAGGGEFAPVVGVGIAGTESEQRLTVMVERDVMIDDEFLRHELGFFRFQVDRRVTGPLWLAARPAQGGDSVGYGAPAGPTGTLGCLVKDAVGSTYILSCAHVMAASGNGRLGDSVWQPGPADGGRDFNRIGALSAFQPLEFGGAVPNHIDAALASPDNLGDVRAGIRGSTLDGWTGDAQLDAQVRKVGWATGTTEGIVFMKKLSANFRIQLGTDVRVALFENLLGIAPTQGREFARQGDSGAVVIDKTDAAVGMVIGVAPEENTSYATLIEPVLAHFAVEPA